MPVGFHTWDEFDEYLDNHYHMTCQMDDVVCWYCGDVEKTRLAEKHGCARIDWGRTVSGTVGDGI